MSRPYQFGDDENYRSPLDQRPPNPFPSGQPPSFATNVNRAKTKKWVEAKGASYDGDDWGDFDEDDEYGVQQSQPQSYAGSAVGGRGYTGLQPGPAPAASHHHRSNSFEAGDERRNFSAGAPPPMNTYGGQQSQQPQGVNYPPGHPYAQSRGPANQPYGQPQQSRRSMDHNDSPYGQSQQPRQYSDYNDSPYGSRNASGSYPQPQPQPQTQRDYNPSTMPQPLQTRVSPAPSGYGESPSSARFPPRKSSLSQSTNSGPTSPQFAPVPPSEPPAQSEDPIPRGRTPSGPIRIVRPADIYKRMQEERERERQSIDSERPNLDSPAQRSANSPARQARSQERGSPAGALRKRMSSESVGRSGHRNLEPAHEGGDNLRSPTRLEPVAERKSEYGLPGFSVTDPFLAKVLGANFVGSPTSSAAGDTPTAPSSSYKAPAPDPVTAEVMPPAVSEKSTAPSVPSYAPLGTTTQAPGVSETSTNEGLSKPALPDFNTGPSFGDDFWTSSGLPKGPRSPQTPTRAESQTTPTLTIQTSPTQPVPANQNTSADLERNPSLGFRSAVNHAFDVDAKDDKSLPPTPSVARLGDPQSATTVSRSNTNSTSGISPIMSQAPSIPALGSHQFQQTVQRAVDGKPLPAPEASMPSRPQPASYDTSDTAFRVMRKPSPGHSRNVSAETLPGSGASTPSYRRNLNPPSGNNSPARSPALEARKELPGPSEAQFDTVQPISIDTAAIQPTQDFTTREADLASAATTSPDRHASPAGEAERVGEEEKISQRLFLDTHKAPDLSGGRRAGSRSPSPTKRVFPAASPAGSRPHSWVAGDSPIKERSDTSRPESRSGSPSKGRVRDLANMFNAEIDSRRSSVVSHKSGSSWWQSKEDLSMPTSMTATAVDASTHVGPASNVDPSPTAAAFTSALRAKEEQTGRPVSRGSLTQSAQDTPQAPVSQLAPSDRPTSSGRGLSFRPHIPGNWESYITTPGAASPSKEDPTAAEYPGISNAERTPTASRAIPEEEDAPDFTTTPRKATHNVTEETERSPKSPTFTEDPAAALKAAGAALVGAFQTSVGLGHGEDDEKSEESDRASSARDRLPERNESQRRSIGHVYSRPLHFARTESSLASSVPPTPPPKDEVPSFDSSVSRTDFAHRGAPDSPNWIAESTPTNRSRPPLYPELSTDTAPDDLESDRLRKEIVRSLGSPLKDDITQEELGSVADKLDPESNIPSHYHDSSAHYRDSSVLPAEYDSYWAGDNASERSSGISHARKPSGIAELPSTAEEVETPTLRQMPANRGPILDKRFSWERSASDLTEVNRGDDTPQVASPLRELVQDDPELMRSHGGTLETGPAENARDPLADPHEAEKHLGVHVPVGVDGSLAAAADAGRSSFEGGLHVINPEETGETPLDEVKPLTQPVVLPSGPVLPDEKNRRVSLGPELPPHSTANAGPQAPPPRIPAFREILALKSPEERIKAFDYTREQFANMNTGLSTWLSGTIEKHPEHMEAKQISTARRPTLTASGMPNTVSSRHRPSPSLARLSNKLAGPRAGPSQQEGGPETPISAGPDGRTPVRLSSGQIQTKGKDLLHSAGVFGGKASNQAKGFFAKGMKKLKEREDGGGGGKALPKTPPKTDRPEAASRSTSWGTSISSKKRSFSPFGRRRSRPNSLVLPDPSPPITSAEPLPLPATSHPNGSQRGLNTSSEVLGTFPTAIENVTKPSAEFTTSTEDPFLQSGGPVQPPGPDFGRTVSNTGYPTPPGDTGSQTRREAWEDEGARTPPKQTINVDRLGVLPSPANEGFGIDPISPVDDELEDSRYPGQAQQHGMDRLVESVVRHATPGASRDATPQAEVQKRLEAPIELEEEDDDHVPGAWIPGPESAAIEGRVELAADAAPAVQPHPWNVEVRELSGSETPSMSDYHDEGRDGMVRRVESPRVEEVEYEAEVDSRTPTAPTFARGQVSESKLAPDMDKTPEFEQPTPRAETFAATAVPERRLETSVGQGAVRPQVTSQPTFPLLNKEQLVASLLGKSVPILGKQSTAQAGAERHEESARSQTPEESNGAEHNEESARLHTLEGPSGASSVYGATPRAMDENPYEQETGRTLDIPQELLQREPEASAVGAERHGLLQHAPSNATQGTTVSSLEPLRHEPEASRTGGERHIPLQHAPSNATQGTTVSSLEPLSASGSVVHKDLNRLRRAPTDASVAVSSIHESSESDYSRSQLGSQRGRVSPIQEPEFEGEQTPQHEQFAVPVQEPSRGVSEPEPRRRENMDATRERPLSFTPLPRDDKGSPLEELSRKVAQADMDKTVAEDVPVLDAHDGQKGQGAYEIRDPDIPVYPGGFEAGVIKTEGHGGIRGGRVAGDGQSGGGTTSAVEEGEDEAPQPPPKDRETLKARRMSQGRVIYGPPTPPELPDWKERRRMSQGNVEFEPPVTDEPMPQQEGVAREQRRMSFGPSPPEQQNNMPMEHRRRSFGPSPPPEMQQQMYGRPPQSPPLGGMQYGPPQQYGRQSPYNGGYRPPVHVHDFDNRRQSPASYQRHINEVPFTREIIDPRQHTAEYSLPGVGPPEPSSTPDRTTRRNSTLLRGFSRSQPEQRPTPPPERIQPGLSLPHDPVRAYSYTTDGGEEEPLPAPVPTKSKRDSRPLQPAINYHLAALGAAGQSKGIKTSLQHSRESSVTGAGPTPDSPTKGILKQRSNTKLQRANTAGQENKEKKGFASKLGSLFGRSSTTSSARPSPSSSKEPSSNSVRSRLTKSTSSKGKVPQVAPMSTGPSRSQSAYEATRQNGQREPRQPARHPTLPPNLLRHPSREQLPIPPVGFYAPRQTPEFSHQRGASGDDAIAALETQRRSVSVPMGPPPPADQGLGRGVSYNVAPTGTTPPVPPLPEKYAKDRRRFSEQIPSRYSQNGYFENGISPQNSHGQFGYGSPGSGESSGVVSPINHDGRRQSMGYIPGPQGTHAAHLSLTGSSQQQRPWMVQLPNNGEYPDSNPGSRRTSEAPYPPYQDGNGGYDYVHAHQRQMSMGHRPDGRRRSFGPSPPPQNPYGSALGQHFGQHQYSHQQQMNYNQPYYNYNQSQGQDGRGASQQQYQTQQQQQQRQQNGSGGSGISEYQTDQGPPAGAQYMAIPEQRGQKGQGAYEVRDPGIPEYTGGLDAGVIKTGGHGGIRGGRVAEGHGGQGGYGGGQPQGAQGGYSRDGGWGQGQGQVGGYGGYGRPYGQRLDSDDEKPVMRGASYPGQEWAPRWDED